ncbi:RHS repeat domain-containing protein, partial [Salinivibrio sp. ML290]|uniref:RHS repeat domain-containing protein n=1 Tax=Salinivibrio sp. ML290 TaxID=1909468 RepID=UPI0018E2B1D4
DTQTHYLWDGAHIVQQQQATADGQVLQQTEYLYEPGSSRPMAQVTHHEQGSELHYIVTDHAGTPQELCNEQGDIVWRGEQALWGHYHGQSQRHWKRREEAANDSIQCDLRYQGQLEDAESGLYYNVNRYYDADSGQYLSPDPIGFAGGLRPQAYVANPLEWVDPLGLNSTNLNKKLGGIKGDNLSAHHIIPVDVWNKNKAFLDEVGLSGRRDSVENGILIPGSEKAYKNGTGKGVSVYHSSNHNNYSSEVERRIGEIERDYRAGLISKDEARIDIRKEQMQLRRDIWSGNVSKNCKGRLN